MSSCTKCGAPISEGAAFCGSCGASLARESVWQEDFPPPPGYHQRQQHPHYHRRPLPRKKMDPLILATIIIIVIILAVSMPLIYLMFSDGGGYTGYSTPAGAWSQVSASSSTTGKLTFGAFTSEVAPEDIVIYVTEDGNWAGSMYIYYSGYSSTQSITWIGAPTGASATYYDYNPSGGTINSGDYISLSGLSPDTVYSFEVFHMPTDATVSMTGAGPSFTTPSDYYWYP